MARAQNQMFQLAQSVPLETELAHPGLPTAQKTWIEMIQNAKKTIDLAQFYIAAKPGEALDPVLDALQAAGERGIKIRFLIANTLLDEDVGAFSKLKTIKNIEVRIYNVDKTLGGILHAKYWIVDNKIIYVGSQNFDWRALEHIHETGVKVDSPSLAKKLASIFEIDWKYAKSGKFPKIPRRSLKAPAGEIELVASPAQVTPSDIRYSLDALIELISQAKNLIKIQLLNYTPQEKKDKFWPPIDNALRSAAVRGVKVELMVSDWNHSKPGIDHLKSLSLIPNISIRIVTIPPYSKNFIPFARVIHTKLMTIDDATLWIGTSNWGRDYFEESRNVELIIKNKEMTQTARAIHSKLWESTYAKPIQVSTEYVMPQRSEKK